MKTLILLIAVAFCSCSARFPFESQTINYSHRIYDDYLYPCVFSVVLTHDTLYWHTTAWEVRSINERSDGSYIKVIAYYPDRKDAMMTWTFRRDRRLLEITPVTLERKNVEPLIFLEDYEYRY